jgi:hypothetical protein
VITANQRRAEVPGRATLGQVRQPIIVVGDGEIQVEWKLLCSYQRQR